MNRELEKQKELTNKIFGYYTSYKDNQLTYDRALELGSRVLNDYAESKAEIKELREFAKKLFNLYTQHTEFPYNETDIELENQANYLLNK